MAGHAALRVLAGSDGTLRLGASATLEELLREAFAAGCELALVEGFKGTPGAKAWLRRDDADAPPQDVRDVVLDLLGSQALALAPEELWRIAPRRTF